MNTERSFKGLDLTKLNESPMTMKIVGGPPKGDLINAFEYAYDKTAKVPADFDVEYTVPTGRICATITRGKARLKVAGIEWEDGTNHNFNLKGYIEDLGLIRFTAFYNAKTRRGTITISKQ